ncbi:C40 family peptidase [uncultured Bacteroides sp.]|uniref:C40 family peptidase n=1 Tax=uncultured Bacteroides sp. TaxID=162156 RepID=UPI002AAB2BD0|nr:C40 family peptidase [uncultured Bacteroides sp.]
MKKRVFLFLLLFSGVILYNYASAKVLPKRIKKMAESVEQRFAPDKRTAVFELEIKKKRKTVTLNGVTSIPQAKAELISSLREKKYKIVDNFRLLPDSLLGENVYGVVNLSVVNIRKKVSFASEMMTQALLGTPVKILQENEWYRVQTPDSYISWVNSSSIYPMTKVEFNAWNAADKIVVTSHYGFTYENADVNSQNVSDIVSGDMLKWEGTEGEFYKVSYPDGRMAYMLKNAGMPESKWLNKDSLNAENIIYTGKTLMGIPYLWGGMSAKGLDCSGFVRTVMFLNGVILPRDASQQSRVGEKIDISNGFNNLKPGDLLFFGRKATPELDERIIHVAIYIGNQKFIHSQGYVHISSFNPQDKEFDQYNLNRLVSAVRILGHLDSAGISTIKTNLFYQPQL